MATTSYELVEPKLDTSLIVPEEFEQFRHMVQQYRSGKVEPDLFRRYRLQNGIYGIRNETDVHMIRVKVPFGRLTANQLDGLADVMENYSDGRGHITTRQDIQFYWIPIERVPDMLADLAKVGLTSREACGNTVRNVTADPLAGVAPDEIFDIRPYANTIVRFLLRNPIAQNLPRKFKISLSGSDADRALSAMHDLGIIAALKQENGKYVRGFKVYIGGGLGSSPRAAIQIEDFTTEENLLPTVEAAVRIFDRYGNRQNRSKARIKFVVEQMGHEAFRALVIKERDIAGLFQPTGYPSFDGPEDQIGWVDRQLPIASEHGRTNIPDDVQYERWLADNVTKQKQTGFAAVQVAIPGGDLWSRHYRRFADIARRFGQGEIFTTVTQNLVLRWVPESELYDLYMALREMELSESGSYRLWNVVGCPGADTCNLAITTSHQLTLELSNRLRGNMAELGFAEDLKDVDIKISGCPNSCGQHHIAAIGFYGGARRLHGEQVPHYMMMLGGRIGTGSAVFGTPVISIPAKLIPEAVQRVIGFYREQRTEGETYHQWIDRIGPVSLKDKFNDLRDVPEMAVATEIYKDWGQDMQFKLQVGEGECAV
jgi:sulfite reductase beta subunit-like hemoprotein